MLQCRYIYDVIHCMKPYLEIDITPKGCFIVHENRDEVLLTTIKPILTSSKCSINLYWGNELMQKWIDQALRRNEIQCEREQSKQQAYPVTQLEEYLFRLQNPLQHKSAYCCAEAWAAHTLSTSVLIQIPEEQNHLRSLSWTVVGEWTKLTRSHKSKKTLTVAIT